MEELGNAAHLDVSSPMSRATAAAGLAMLSGGAATIAYFDPSKANFFPVCPLYALTGFACPGCGMTRGFHALFHGDVLTALDYNALLPIWALAFGYVFVSLALFTVRGRGLSMKVFHPTALWVFLIALLLFGVLRNLPFFPFRVLFP